MKPTVLVVDDDRIDRRAVRRSLDNSFEVLEADSGGAALTWVHQKRPECVVLDYNIPGTDTLQLLADLAAQRIAVVMLTGGGNESLVAAAFKAGAQDYLVKGDYETQTLRHSVQLAIDKVGRRRDREQSRTRLHEAFRQQTEKLKHYENELRVARDIEQNLVPHAPPELPGFEFAGVYVPAEATGGDFFDYVWLADKTLAIVVADVSGHGLGPALLAADTRAYVRGLSQAMSDVAMIVEAANRLLCDDVPGGQFVTLAMARIDPIARTLYYASAGHPGYVIRESGEVVEFEPAIGPLGLEDDERVPSETSIDLQSGDLILMLTDGLPESIDANRVLLGWQECVDLVYRHRADSASRIIDRLQQAAAAHTGGRQISDDQTVVVVKVH